MKKIFIIFIICLFINCRNNNKKIIVDDSYNDSVRYYLSLVENINSVKEKINYTNKACRIILNEKNTLENRKHLDLVINNYFNLNEMDEYNDLSKTLLKRSIKVKDTLHLAKAYRYQGNCFYQIRQLDSSFYCYLKAEGLYSKIKDKENYAVVLLKKGVVQLDINDFLGADISLTKAYSILKDTDDYQRIFVTLNSIGIVASELKEYERAITNYNNALEIVNKEKLYTNEHQEAICLNNIGLAYYDLNNFKKAIFYFEKSLKNKKIKIDNPELYSNIIDNLAFTKLKTSNYESLEKLFNESLKIRKILKNQSSIVLSYIHLSDYYIRIDDTINSVKYSTLAVTAARQTKIPKDLIKALKQSVAVDKKNAHKFSNEYISISDSLQFEDIKNKDRFARIELETDELRQENTQLSEQNRDILNYFMIAIVFGGFLFFARFQRLKARELALKQTQQQANEEIYRLIISHQNQLEEGRDLEKKRISKELHDGVLGRLFGLRLNLDGLNNFDDDETKQQRLDYLNELKIIEQDLREISHELSRENLVLINNFVAIINNLLEQQTKINTAKINTLISDKIDWEKVSNTIKINLYRILQESLQNINKHAEAKTINVIFNKDSKGNLIFSIEDDGKGYNTNGKKTKGIGVNNIVDRVHQCQGKIDIKSQIGKGTKIIITFPLENETINM